MVTHSSFLAWKIMNREACQATAHTVVKSGTQMSMHVHTQWTDGNSWKVIETLISPRVVLLFQGSALLQFWTATAWRSGKGRERQVECSDVDEAMWVLLIFFPAVWKSGPESGPGARVESPCLSHFSSFFFRSRERLVGNTTGLGGLRDRGLIKKVLMKPVLNFNLMRRVRVPVDVGEYALVSDVTATVGGLRLSCLLEVFQEKH